jgi:hypothetical protein
MKALRFVVVSQLLAWAAFAVEVRYVSPTGADHPPYTSWETAARRIQSAVDASDPADIVVVGPGEYVEQVTLKEGMVLWGSGPSRTALHQPEGALFVVRGGARVEIRDLTIAGQPPQEIGFDWTRGILLEGGAGQLVSNCGIRGFGFGILAEGLVLGEPCVIRDTTVSACATGIRLNGSQARCAVEGCTIRESGREGLALRSMRDALITRTTFEGCGLRLKYTPDVGLVACAFRCAGQYEAIFSSFSRITIANSLIAGPVEGIIMSEHLLSHTLDIIGSTIVGTTTPFRVHDGPVVHIASSIIWGNSQELSDPNIRWMISGVVTSDIEGGGFEPPSPYAPPNIDLDPLFRDSANGDFHLRPDSPCIDYPEWDGALYDFDLDGNPRALYGGRGYDYPVRDLGAYEYRINELQPGPGPNQSTLTWSSLADKSYSIFCTDDLLTWHLVVENSPTAGNETTSWTDDGSKTGVPPSLAPRRFYRVLENW